MMSEEKPKGKRRKSMEMNLDRGRRVRGTIGYWLALLAVGAILALLLERFTGSKLIAIALAGGMLLYMLIASAIASKNLSQAPGDGRLD